MAQKVRIFLVILIVWAVGFLAWEWWYSYPKVNLDKIRSGRAQTTKLDSILLQAIIDYRLPGVTVALVQEGKVSYLKAIGYANLETKDSLKVDSPILVASVSKLVTALAVANVLDDKGIQAQGYISDLGIASLHSFSSLPNFSLSDLLSHESGLRDKTFSEMIFSSSRSQSLQIWGEDFLAHGSKYQTELSYSYADTNFDFLGFLLSQSENQDFETLIQNAALTPAGMVNSSFLTAWPMEINELTGYQKTFLWKRLEPKRINFRIFPSPSSGLLTTTKDMSLLLIHLLRDEMGIFHDALDWLRDGENVVPLGFQKTKINGSEWIGHFGGQAGYSSLLFYSIEADMGIFFFANAKDNEDFRIAIANQIISTISP
ncbi:serine hydrolase [Algoriphagus sp.]|uniref:serine hydrolase domain-containing protein n=1 Tax=Algoriphagus sp. TaxID=1872435 RepID=UPI003281E7D7